MTDVAITGATGFIGKALVRHLLARGCAVRLLARRPDAARKSLGERPTIIRGDLADPKALSELVEPASHVVHLAGAVRGASRKAFDKVNVDGTRNLLEALGDSSVPLIHMSSLAAREPGLSWYASSKALAEDIVRERCEQRPALILRPPAVYGPGDAEMLPVFRFMRRTGVAPVPGSPEARLSLLFVDDLVNAIVKAVETRDAPNGVYCLHDGRVGGYNWFELCETVGAACGRKVKPRRIPAAVMGGVASLNLASSLILRRDPMLTPAKLRELRHRDWVCDNEAISTAMDWSPRVRLAEGLLRTPGWRD